MRLASEARNSPRTMRTSREPLFDVSSRANEPTPRHSGAKRFAHSPLTPSAVPRRSRASSKRPAISSPSSSAFQSLWESVVDARLGTNEQVLSADATDLHAVIDFVNLERAIEKEYLQDIEAGEAMDINRVEQTTTAESPDVQ